MYLWLVRENADKSGKGQGKVRNFDILCEWQPWYHTFSTCQQSTNKWIKLSGSILQKVQSFESFIFILIKYSFVANILCKILYWNHLKVVSLVYWKAFVMYVIIKLLFSMFSIISNYCSQLTRKLVLYLNLCRKIL